MDFALIVAGLQPTVVAARAGDHDARVVLARAWRDRFGLRALIMAEFRAMGITSEAGIRALAGEPTLESLRQIAPSQILADIEDAAERRAAAAAEALPSPAVPQVIGIAAGVLGTVGAVLTRGRGGWLPWVLGGVGGAAGVAGTVVARRRVAAREAVVEEAGANAQQQRSAISAQKITIPRTARRERTAAVSEPEFYAMADAAMAYARTEGTAIGRLLAAEAAPPTQVTLPAAPSGGRYIDLRRGVELWTTLRADICSNYRDAADDWIGRVSSFSLATNALDFYLAKLLLPDYVTGTFRHNVFHEQELNQEMPTVRVSAVCNGRVLREANVLASDAVWTSVIYEPRVNAWPPMCGEGPTRGEFVAGEGQERLWATTRVECPRHVVYKDAAEAILRDASGRNIAAESLIFMPSPGDVVRYWAVRTFIRSVSERLAWGFAAEGQSLSAARIMVASMIDALARSPAYQTWAGHVSSELEERSGGFAQQQDFEDALTLGVLKAAWTDGALSLTDLPELDWQDRAGGVIRDNLIDSRFWANVAQGAQTGGVWGAFAAAGQDIGMDMMREFWPGGAEVAEVAISPREWLRNNYGVDVDITASAVGATWGNGRYRASFAGDGTFALTDARSQRTLVVSRDGLTQDFVPTDPDEIAAIIAQRARAEADARARAELEAHV